MDNQPLMMESRAESRSDLGGEVERERYECEEGIVDERETVSRSGVAMAQLILSFRRQRDRH